MAESFARNIAKEPARFGVAQADADELSAAVAKFGAAYQASRFGQRSAAATMAKDQAREDAERIIRRLGHLVRANLQLDAATKILLGIKERSQRPKILPCPQEPPRLRFVRALHEGNGAMPMHELEFSPLNYSSAKPAGAVRLELFVDLIVPEEEVPGHPGANHGGRPWYLRSFTRSPIKLVPPLARVPMRVLYWGRWADSLGNVGPFSATAAAWVEGGAHLLKEVALPGRKGQVLLDGATGRGPAGRETTYVMALIETQYASLHAQEMSRALPMSENQEQRWLAGQQVSEAA